MKKKNLFGLLLFMLISLFTSQTWAASIVVDWQLKEDNVNGIYQVQGDKMAFWTTGSGTKYLSGSIAVVLSKTDYPNPDAVEVIFDDTKLSYQESANQEYWMFPFTAKSANLVVKEATVVTTYNVTLTNNLEGFNANWWWIKDAAGTTQFDGTTATTKALAENTQLTLTLNNSGFPAEKSIEDVIVTWKGTEVSQDASTSTSKWTYTITVDGEGELKLEWKEVEPADYCQPAYDHPTRDNRSLSSLSLSDGTNSVSLSSFSSTSVYSDKTADVLETTAGATITITPSYSGSWVHGYMFVDYNGDKQFADENPTEGYLNFNVGETGIPAAGSELVSYSYFGAQDGYGDVKVESGYNSAGEYQTGGSSARGAGLTGTNMPSFVVPADLETGNYRVRFIVNWNSIDPCCEVYADANDGTSNRFDNVNGAYVVDFTLKVVEAAPATYAVEVVANGATYELTGADDLTAVVEGTTLTLSNVVAPEGYNLVAVKWNGETLTEGTSGYTFTVNAEGTLTIVVEEAAPEAPEYTIPQSVKSSSRYVSGVNFINAEGSSSIYTGSASSNYYNLVETPITVKQGEEFSLQLLTGVGTGDWHFHLEIYADWNGDGEFTGSFPNDDTSDAENDVTQDGTGEWIKLEGTHNSANQQLEDYTQAFTVPADAVVGTARIRARYTGSWHVRGNDGASKVHGPNEVVNEGMVIDIPVTIVEGTSAPTTYTVNVVTPENGTIVLKNGTEEVASGTALAENTTIVVEATAAEGYELASVWVGTSENIAEAEELTASDEGVYSFPLADNAYVFATFTEKAPAAAEYIYRAENLEFAGTASMGSINYVPDTEAAEIINADALTIAVEYSLDASAITGSGPAYGLALTSATDLNAIGGWATAAIISWGTNNHGMTIRYNENGGQYSQSNANLTGEHVKVVYVLTADGYEYYVNGEKVKEDLTNDARFKTLAPNANSVQIGVCENTYTYLYPFDGTIHSITYYGKGDMNLTAEQFNALFPAATTPEEDEYTVTLDIPEDITYTLNYYNNDDYENPIAVNSGDKVAANTLLYLQLTDAPEGTVVTWNEEPITIDSGFYMFRVNENGTLKVAVDEVSDVNVITLDMPEGLNSDAYGFFYYDYNNNAFVDVDPSAINKDLSIIYFALIVPTDKIVTVTLNGETLEAYDEYDNNDGTIQYSYYFYNTSGTIKVTLTDPTYAVKVKNPDNVEYAIFRTADIYKFENGNIEVASGTQLVVYVDLAEGQELESVTWKEDGEDAEVLTIDDDLGGYTFVVNNNGTLAINLVGGTTVVEYCTYEGKHNNDNGRQFNSLTLNDFTFAEEIGYGDAVYNDRTENVWEAEAGQEVTVNVDWSGSWMHGYLYIDYDQDGEFDANINADGTPAAGSEIVAYNFYSADGGSTGYNSLGETTGNNPGFGSFPGFKLPEDLDGGDYRVRFKLDWNEIDPCGIHADGQNSLTANGGLILDLTMRIPSTAEPAFAVEVPETDGTNYYQFRFDDIVLGNHTNDNGNKGDERARNFTMSTWVKAKSINGGQLMGHGQAVYYNAEGTFGVHMVDGKLQLVSRHWVSGAQCDGDVKKLTDATLAVDEWAFVTVVVDDTNKTISLYKNGILVTTESMKDNGIGLLADECVFFVGNNLACVVDEVQVWNKALTTEEVRASMRGVTADDALVAYYQPTGTEDVRLLNLGSYQETEVEGGLYSGTESPGQWGATNYEGDYTDATIVEGHVFQKYTVNVTTTGEGTVAVMNGDVEVATGKKVAEVSILNVVATPAEGYVLESITVNGVALEADAEFAVTANTEIAVVFASTTFSITTSVDDQTSNYESYVEIQDQDGNTYNDGEKLPAGSEARLVFFHGETNNEVTSLKVAGSDEELKDQIVENVYVIGVLTENLTFEIVIQEGSGINGVDADDKAIYYADGVVYNYAGEIAIYDVNGQLIVRTSETTVDVRDLVNGVYIVRSADKVVRFVK